MTAYDILILTQQQHTLRDRTHLHFTHLAVRALYPCALRGVSEA